MGGNIYARYEEDIASEGMIDKAVADLVYFRDAMVRLYQEKELSDGEVIDLMGLVNTIITHITNGNENEERLVNVMGGAVIELESEKLVRQGMNQGRVQMIIELGQEDGLGDEVIIDRLQRKAGLPLENAKLSLARYRK